MQLSVSLSHFSRHSQCSHQHPRTNDHNHLSSDSPHLSPAIKTPVISSFPSLTVWSTVHYPNQARPTSLTCVFLHLDSFSVTANPAFQTWLPCASLTSRHLLDASPYNSINTLVLPPTSVSPSCVVTAGS